MWQALHDAWWRLATQTQPRSFSDALACGALQAGAVAFRAAVTLRNAAYDRGWARQVRLPCRVVSVGNLTVGGSGKTACVELIARKLLAQGRRVAVLSRGYGGPRQDPSTMLGMSRGLHYWLQCENGRLLVDGHEAGADELADEPQLLAQHLAGVPILVGSRRDRTGVVACQEFDADVTVLDDGFQHRRLQRDCDIVLIHSRMPLNGWPMLPRGPMREHLSSLKRAHIIILTKADEALDTLGAMQERLRSFNRHATWVTASHEPIQVLEAVPTGRQADTGRTRDLQTLEGVRIGLLSSIGDPQGFEGMVRRLHATVLWHRAFPDHHPYQASDWDAVRARALVERPEALITTEKDWVRLQPVTAAQGAAPAPVWVLGVVMQLLSGEDDLDARLAGVGVR